MAKRGEKCIACRRPVEVGERRWGTGPVCIPCYFAAKLKYENGITDIKDLDPRIANEMMNLFHKANCSWPFDLINRWETVDFEKVAKDPRKIWWFQRNEEGYLEPVNKLF